MASGWGLVLAAILGVGLLVAIAGGLDFARRSSPAADQPGSGRVTGYMAVVYVIFAAVVTVLAINMFAHGHVVNGLLVLASVAFFGWRAVSLFSLGRRRRH